MKNTAPKKSNEELCIDAIREACKKYGCILDVDFTKGKVMDQNALTYKIVVLKVK